MELVNEQDLEMVLGGQGTVNLTSDFDLTVHQTNRVDPGGFTSNGGTGGAVTAASFGPIIQGNSFILSWGIVV